MKALFITTKTVDCENHVRAWDSFAAEQAEHVTFDHGAICNDHLLVQAAREYCPDVIFYIGAAKARGIPRPGALCQLRDIAPSIHLCSDATDHPWHPVLAAYRTRGCFDLQVSIDGARDAPVDMATLTPVGGRPFAPRGPRDIRCGFSGTVGRHNSRSEAINALSWLGGLTVRDRLPENGYDEHALFLTWCRMVLNLSWTGTQAAHHMKGRVIEAGLAGCALLEHADSPIADWFRPDCYIPWRSVEEAAAIIADISHDDIDARARALSARVREDYTAAKIYGAMLERIGLDVGNSKPLPPA